MKRNPFKDKSTPKPTPKPQPVVQTEEQKAFEAEVQERIRQAKMQLKAENPFTKEESQNEATRIQVGEDKKNSTANGTKTFEEEVQERIRQAKLELKANSPLAKDESTPEVIPPIPSKINEGAEKQIEEWTKKWEHQSEELAKAQQQIKNLENQLSEAKKSTIISQTQTSKSDRKPVYGMSASTPNTESINRDDLKLEFLNFTSAHIDQFNTRIKKTEELISALANQQPIETKKEKANTPWSQWINTGLLAACAALLLGLYFKNNSSNDKEIKSTNVSNKESAPVKNQPALTTLANENTTTTAAQQPKNSPVATTTKTNTPAKLATPAPAGNTNVLVSTPPKPTSIPSTSKPTATPTQNVVAKTSPPAPVASNPPTTINKPISNTTPTNNKPLVATKPLANAAPQKNVPTTVAKAPSPKPTPTPAPKSLANNSVLKAKPAPKPLVKTNPIPTPKSAAIMQSAKQSRERKDQNLAEALRPVENDVQDNRRHASTSKGNFERNTNSRSTEEIKPPVKTQSSKPKQQNNDVFFGDD